MKRILFVVALLAGLGTLAPFLAAETAGGNKEALDAIRGEIRQRMMQSGTLDMYDAEKNAVRNLQTVKFPEEVQEQGGKKVAVIKYRDTNSGDLVDVEAVVEPVEGALRVTSLKMAEITALKKEPVAEDKEYSDDEIQAFMNDYLAKQAQFTGTVMLYDEERGKMRQLKLLQLSDEVRRMGIYAISRAELEDTESGDILGVDISVEKRKGGLDIQALRIRDVKPGKK